VVGIFAVVGVLLLLTSLLFPAVSIDVVVRSAVGFPTVAGVPFSLACMHAVVGLSAVAGFLQLLTSILFLVFLPPLLLIGVPSDVGVPRIHVVDGVSAVVGSCCLLTSLLFRLFPSMLLFLLLLASLL
jgi:hypothetical protein